VRALVTGADGFVGGWLVAHLSSLGDDVWELVGRGSHKKAHSRLSIDVRRPSDVRSALRWARPDVVYHLAGMAFGPDAARDPSAAVAVNVGGTVNLLTGAAAMDYPPIVLVAGSAEVYGRPRSLLPIAEDAPIAPTSLYGASKAASELFARAFHDANGVPVVLCRAFNHIGPGQRREFVVSSFAHQLATFSESGFPPVLNVGNLNVVRDFTDVRDVVRAYRLLVVGRHFGEPFNVASGHGTAVGDVARKLVAISGVDAEIVVDPSRVRPNEASMIVGDPSKLMARTGWSPRIPLDQTLRDIWRHVVS
jgi:GDP-4-dehydro-6-deoxy-D-mannose reductase